LIAGSRQERRFVEGELLCETGVIEEAIWNKAENVDLPELFSPTRSVRGRMIAS
jgi:hypothetical protein